jgi:hypothetical protein
MKKGLATLAVLTVMSLLTLAGPARGTASDVPVSVCSGKIVVPANVGSVRTPDNADCTGQMNVVATINGSPVQSKGIWVRSVRDWPQPGALTIQLNTAHHTELLVAWFMFKSP